MKLNILYCCDDNYAPFVGISMASVMENNKSAEEITFYVVCDNVSDGNICRLRRQTEKYGETRQLVVVDGRDYVARLDELTMLTYRGGHAANLRLFFVEYIKPEVERLLYLDGDIIITADLCPLFETPMEKGEAVSVVLDSLTAFYKHYIGFKPEEPYFNSGVILFDIENWKKGNCQDELIHLLRDHPSDSFVNPDQDVLNLLLKDKKVILPPTYNFQTTHTAYSDKTYYATYSSLGYYTAEQIAEARRSPIIIHAYRFLGELPWHAKSKHPWASLWSEYAALSEWSDLSPTPSKGLLFKIERILYGILPKSIFLPLFKSYQSYTFRKKFKEASKNGKKGNIEK